VLARYSGVDRVDLRSSHALRIFNRLLDRAGRFLDVGDDSFAQPRRPSLTDAQDSE
jgi:hypothetical protein